MAENKFRQDAYENVMIQAEDLNCYEFFLKATDKYGEYYAIQHMDQKYTRTEFIQDIEALATYFKKVMHFEKGDCFTVFTPTNVESVIAFYALNKIGAIVNFVHPLLPTEVLRDTIEESHSKGVMIEDLLCKDHVDTLNQMGIPVILCRNSDYASPIKTVAARAGEAILENIFPKFNNVTAYSDIMRMFRGRSVPSETHNGYDTAVYLNGGGTTGKSKTIKISSKSINEIIHSFGSIDHIVAPGEEAMICILPYFHSFGLVVSMHMPVCNAARLIPIMRFDSKLVVKLYKENRISGIVGIPNMFKKLYYAKGFDGPHLSNTRMMFVGGDDLSPSFLKEFNDMLKKNGTDATLRQGYGLTEAASVCCANTNWTNKEDSIGIPLENIKMAIWDEDCHEVPNGTVGEIVIAGPTIMQGYLTKDGPEDEGLYYDKDGVAWVRSGDLGYRDDDGFFFFSGRKKRLIIISGYNVYPVDIENLMDTLPYIRESCAVRGIQNGKPIVKLYVSLNNKNKSEEAMREEITTLCENNLSKFSVPRDIEFLDTLPHTPLEKIDFMKLQARAEGKE